MHGPYRGFVELPRAVLDALRESLEAVVDHAIKEQERTRVTPRTPRRSVMLDVSDAMDIFWREIAPKARLECYRRADRDETRFAARCLCGRKAVVPVPEWAIEDCAPGARVEMIANVLERLARAVNSCHCVTGAAK